MRHKSGVTIAKQMQEPLSLKDRRRHHRSEAASAEDVNGPVPRHLVHPLRKLGYVDMVGAGDPPRRFQLVDAPDVQDPSLSLLLSVEPGAEVVDAGGGERSALLSCHVPGHQQDLFVAGQKPAREAGNAI